MVNHWSDERQRNRENCPRSSGLRRKFGHTSLPASTVGPATAFGRRLVWSNFRSQRHPSQSCEQALDATSTAAVYLHQDTSGTGSTLTGAINSSDTGKTVSLTMDAASTWVVTGTSYLTALTDADSSYSNITCQISGCQVYIGTTEIK